MLAPECEGVSAEPSIVQQGRKAADWWEAHGVEVHRRGTVVVALGRDQSELTTLARRAPAANWLDRDGIAALEPHLAEQFTRALFIENEAHLDPRSALIGCMINWTKNGVQFAKEANHSGNMIDCRGLSASDDLKNLRGVKGEMVIIRSADIELSRPVRLLHPRFSLYIVPRGDGVFMLGATQIESRERGRARCVGDGIIECRIRAASGVWRG